MNFAQQASTSACGHRAVCWEDTTKSDNEAFEINLSRLDSRVFALSFVVSAFSRSLEEASEIEARVAQLYQKGTQTVAKQAMRFRVPPDSVPMRDKQIASIILIAELFQVGGAWSFRAETELGLGTRSSDLAALARRQLYSSVGYAMVSPDLCGFKSIRDLSSAITPVVLRSLRKEFPSQGLQSDEFVKLLVRVLSDSWRGAKASEKLESEIFHLVGLLNDLFEQIDVHATGFLRWEDFSGYCMQSAALATMQKASSVSDLFYYRRVGKQRVFNRIRCSRFRRLPEFSRLVCVAGGMVHFIHPVTLQVSEHLDADKREFLSQFVSKSSSEDFEDQLVTVHDVELIPERDQFVVSTSQFAIVIFIKKKAQLVWQTDISCQVPQVHLKWCPSFTRVGDLISVGADHNVYIWVRLALPPSLPPTLPSLSPLPPPASAPPLHAQCTHQRVHP